MSEPFGWMLRHKETGTPFWDEDSCVWDNRYDAEESAEYNADYEAVALYTSPPTTPAVESESAESERARIVAWLRSNSRYGPGDYIHLAKAIERLDHH